MKETILKWSIFISGIICFYAFISIRSLPLMNTVLKEKIIPEHWEHTKYGELYNFNRISHFKEKLPPASEKYRFSSKHPSLEEADIIIFGDSFLDFTRQETFPERLADSTNRKVYFERYDFPLKTFTQKGYSNKEPKLFIYETVERNIARRFYKPHTVKISVDSRSKVRQKGAKYRDFLFYKKSEEMYTKLMKRSYFTTNIYAFISTIKFDLFGFISSLTPKYYLDDDHPWLFNDKQLNDKNTSFYYQHTQEEIDTYCDNIVDLANKLKKQYNLDFVFLPIPNKYTIYHHLINDDPYNNLLPLVYEGLDKRGIKVVKFLDEFINSEKILFYGTDTHWNKEGVDIALKKTIEILYNFTITKKSDSKNNI